MLTHSMLIKYLQGNHHYAFFTDDTTLDHAERTHGKKAQNLTCLCLQKEDPTKKAQSPDHCMHTRQRERVLVRTCASMSP